MNRSLFLSRYLFQTAPVQSVPSFSAATEASVLIPLLDDGGPLNLLLTRRSSHLRHHPGQISFPGGRRDPTDSSLMHTALRECQEEIGLQPDQVEIIGCQPRLSTVTGYLVTPWVGLVPADHPFTADRNEVEELIEVPLDFLLDERNWETKQFSRGGRKFKIWFVQYQQDLIWGATASILHQFLRQIRDHSPLN